MAHQTTNKDTLRKLFPVPATAPSMQAPARFPGTTIETTDVLQDRLMDNHVKWHIFFNKKRYHK